MSLGRRIGLFFFVGLVHIDPSSYTTSIVSYEQHFIRNYLHKMRVIFVTHALMLA